MLQTRSRDHTEDGFGRGKIFLGRRVDVATERGLKPRIREQILQEAVRL